MQTNSTTVPEGISLDDLLTVEKMAEAYPAFMTVETLRWQLRHRDTNGLASCCVRIGKRLLIAKSRYEAWLASRAGVAA